MCIWECVHMCSGGGVCVFVHRVCVHMCTYVYICVYMCTYVCMLLQREHLHMCTRGNDSLTCACKKSNDLGFNK